MNAVISAMTRDLGSKLAVNLEDGFAELVRTHLDFVYSVALRMTGNAHDAEEIAQDAFENAYRALRRYPVERLSTLRPKPWLARIAVNAARTRLRRKAHPTRPLTGTDEVAASGAEPDSSWDGLLARLPERYRAAVILRYVEDLPYADVAAALGQPVGTVKTNVHRAVGLLRKALEEEGITP